MPQAKRTITPLRILLLLIVLVGVYYLLPQLGAFRTTFTVLRHSLWFWLIVAFLTSCLTFLAGAVTQYAAGNSCGKLSDITLLQFAGSFVNHFLPFSLGGVNLTARYYQKQGKNQTEAITMATIPIIFGVITTVVTVAIISPITLVHLIDKFHINHFSFWLAALVIAIIFTSAIAVFKYKKQARELINQTLTGLKGIVDIRQLSLLSAGSLSITFISALALLASIIAVHASVALISVFTLYITASLVSNIAPTPGGIGATEAVLVIGLVAAGVSPPQAAASTLIFRFFSFWLPIIPGGIALRYLNKQI